MQGIKIIDLITDKQFKPSKTSNTPRIFKHTTNPNNQCKLQELDHQQSINGVLDLSLAPKTDKSKYQPKHLKAPIINK